MKAVQAYLSFTMMVLYSASSFGMGPGTLPLNYCTQTKLQQAQDLILSRASTILELANGLKRNPEPTPNLGEIQDYINSVDIGTIESGVPSIEGNALAVENPLSLEDVAQIVMTMKQANGGEQKFVVNNSTLGNSPVVSKLICGNQKPMVVEISVGCQLESELISMNCL